MKGKKEDKELRELFRKKLEYAEVIPSGSLGPALMRSLGRREFLHFIPSRFNIWYVGGVVAAGAALAFLLVSGSGKKEDLQPERIPDTLNDSKIVINKNNVVSQIQPVIISEEKKQASASDQQIRVPGENPDVKPGRDQSDNADKQNSVPRNIQGPISEKGIITGHIEGKDELQSGTKTVNNLIQASVTRGCTPLKVSFKSASGLYGNYRWEFGDGGCSEQKEPVWLFDVDGEYEVQLQITGSDGARTVSSTTITVHPKPVARLEITPENAVIPDDEIVFHNYSSNAVRFNWDFGDGNSSEQLEPRHTYKKFGNYKIRLVALSEYGCSDTVNLVNAFAGSGYFVNFPNAFIPNPGGPSGGYYSPKSDEAAHVFHPVFAGVSDYQLKIFTRLGILIFETEDINIGWDGYFKGQLSDPGVYIWKVRGSYVNGEPFTKMGDVTMLRN